MSRFFYKQILQPLAFLSQNRSAFLIPTKFQFVTLRGSVLPIEFLSVRRTHKEFYLLSSHLTPTFSNCVFKSFFTSSKKSLSSGKYQFLSQLDEPLRDAILGNAGTIIAFRIGAVDAEFLEKEFAPNITAEDLTNLPNHSVYLKLMIDGKVSAPFSAETVC